MNEDSGTRKRRRKRYSFETEEPRPRQHGTPCMVRTILCLHRPLVKFQQISEKVGFFVAKCPKRIVFFSLLFMAIGSLGLLRFHEPNMTNESFYPSHSLAKKHNENEEPLEKHTGIKEELMIIANKGSNVLVQECLQEALMVHNAVTNITGYQPICMRSTSIKSSSCVMVNVLEVLEFDSRMIQNISAVLTREWNRTVLSNGRTLSFLKTKMFSDFKMEPQGVSAQAMKMIYFLKQPRNETSKVLVRRWENRFITTMDSMKDKLNCARVFFMTESDNKEVISKIFNPHVPALCISIFVLLVFAFLVVLFSAAKGGMFLLCPGVLCTALCTLSSLSLGFAAGASFSYATIVILVFLVGRGIVDVLIVVFELENQMNVLSIKHRIAGCTSKVGLMVTTSVLVDVVVFGLGLHASFTGIKDAFLVALFAVPLRYFFFYPFLLACSCLLLQNYPSSFDQKSLSGLNGKVEKKDEVETEEGQGTFFEKYGKFLTTRTSRNLVLVLTLGIIAGCVYLHQRYNLNQAYQDNTALIKSTHVSTFKSNEVKYFKDIDVSILLLGSTDYKTSSVQHRINRMTNQLSFKSYSTGKMSSWLVQLLSWSQDNRTDCQGDQFTACLQKFFSVPQHALYKKDIVFESKNNMEVISLSRFHLFMKLDGIFANDVNKLRSLRTDVKTLSTEAQLSALPASSRFLVLDMIDTFKRESFKILLVVGLAVLLCPQPLMASIRIGILLVITFILHVEEMIVLVLVWNIPLTPVSFYCLFLGLLWALQLSIRILQVRSIAADVTAEKRTVSSLKAAGPAILFEVLISIACSISLSFIFPFLSTIFLCVLPTFFVLALFHCLALLPTIILVSSKPAEKLMEYMAIEESYDMKAITSNQEIEIVTETQETFNKQRHPTVCITGISCKFPQARNKDEFLEMLSNGTCVVSQFPSNRPEEYELFQDLYHPKRFVKSRICTVGGAFLENIQGFDAEFFKISPQEAPAMDPQQRILLQVVYEAIEDAGLRLEDLQKCKTGVFVGVMNLDYGARVMQVDNRVNMDQFYSTGTTSSIVANRVSFCLNLTGPSLAVDTACSSSLTALKIAQCCLTNGECDVAIVCAPNIILDASVQMTFSIGGLLAPDGRCKCFDASADGYGRGEGFAAVILKPTLVSIADNDEIYCEILACGMNNDGQNATPITAPSPKTQAELAKTVLEDAGITASSIEYVEAHGTGTAIGDVVETTSIASTYCDRSALKQRILRVGSVKSNLNHTESASGLAGLIKVALMIKNEIFLPTINVHSLNPKLKLSEKGMVVQETCEKWIKNDGSYRIAGLNSFGYGGSNVHAILKEVRPQMNSPKHETNKNTFILTLSAKSEDSLKHLAKHFESWLREQPDDPEFKLNLCYSLTERRSHHESRLGLVFSTVNEAADSLAAFTSNRTDSQVISGNASSTKQSLLFVFGGQGANWEGMGKELMEREPLFNKSIYEVDILLKDLGEDWSLIRELTSPEKKRIMGNLIGQPAAFAIQYATYKLLESWGIHPSAVVGHSLGELAAACCCGALSLREALQIVLIRSKWHEKCSSEGSMAALGMPEDEARNLIIDLKLDNTVCIAAVNDQSNVTISGNKESIECIGNHVSTNHPAVFWKVLATARAFHSVYIDAVKTPLCADIEGLKIKPKMMRIPMYSTVLGDKVLGKQLEDQYWWKNMRQPVLFYQAVAHAVEDGYSTIIEISPQPVLKHYLHNIATNTTKTFSNNSTSHLATFPPRKVPAEHKEFLKNTVCKLHTMGYPVYWSTMYGHGPRRLVRFPTYPWKEIDYWYRGQPPPKTLRSLKPRQDQAQKCHPFLKEVKLTEQFSGVMCWETEIDLHRFPTFKDHVLTQGGAVLPGSACVEMAIAMAAERFQRSWGIEVKDVRFTSLLTLPETQVRLLRLRLEMKPNNTEGDFSVCNVQDDGTEMVLAKGSIFVELSSCLPVSLHSSQENQSKNEDVINDALKEVISNMSEVPLSTFRHLAVKFGFDFGPCYCLVRKIWRKDNKAVCMLEMDGPFQGEIPMYIIHPAFVDACFQTSMACEDDEEDNDEATPAVPIGVKCFSVIDPNIPRKTYCHVTKTTSGDTRKYSMRLVDSLGKVYVTIDEFQSTEIANMSRSPKLPDVIYETNWVETRLEGKPADLSDSVIVVMEDTTGTSSSFVDVLSLVCKTKILSVKLPQDNSPCNDLVNDFKTVLAETKSCTKLTIVNFWPVETSSFPFTPENYERCQESSVMGSLEALKFLADVQSSSSATCKLVVVSRCTQYVAGEKNMIPWGSTVWGLCRTARLEFQNIRTINVDLEALDDSEIHLLVKEITVEEENMNDEIVLRGDKRYVNRVTRATPGTKSITEEELINPQLLSRPVYLALNPNTEEICLRKLTQSSNNAEGNIKVCVNNFWIPDEIITRLEKSFSTFIGYSGSVINSGKDGKFSNGDLVFGVTRTNRLGNILQVRENEAIRKPNETSLQQAASLSSCLPLAYYALEQAVSANGSKDALVVIHEANKDLGLAGLLAAKAMGYSVLCTTSDPHVEDSKRRLKEHGALLVTDAHFSDLTTQLSQQAEAAIFFYEPLQNSTRKSCQLLKPCGKIVFLGDIVNNHVIMPSNKSISCQRIDYTDIMDSPGKYQSLWSTCWQLLTSTDSLKNILQIPQQETSIADILTTEHSIKESPRLTRSLSFHSFSFKASTTPIAGQVLPVGMDQYKLKHDRTYMIAGGVRGFGFKVARWMAFNGAGTIILVARSTPSQSKLHEISLLEKKTGARIKVLQADVSDPVQMNEMNTNELAKLPSMAGIVLTAMVLRDQLIPQVEREAFYQVMAPKVKGAYLLHQMSLNMDLDFFVMFSSIASLLGNPGQAAYSAANSFLDSLTCYRRRVLGLPGLSINWGPIKGAGVLQRQENIATLLSRAGYRLLDANQAIEFMGQVLIKQPLTTDVGIFDADWSRLFVASVGISNSTRFESIKQEVEAQQTEKDLTSLGPMILMESDHTKKEVMVEEFVTELIASWLSVTATEIDMKASLYAQGSDSFFALTFKMKLEATLQVSFEVFYFMQPDTTPNKIVQDILIKLKSKQQTNQTEANKPGKTSDENVPDIETVQVETQSAEREYPKDTSCPTATYQVMPLYAPEGASVMFFCVHPAGRYAMNLVPISAAFKTQSLISFYAIGYTDPTMSGDSRSVRQLAKCYVNMIKQLQRHGPYFLGGQSFGGLIAFEMASVLQEQGEDVAFVAMIDTFPWEISNRSAAARLEILFGGTKLEQLMERLFQATFEQVLARLASQTLKMTPEDYDSKRKETTQDGIIDFLQDRAHELDIPLYDIRKLKTSLHQDNHLASVKHREWKPAAVYYQGPLTFLKSVDQRFTPFKPLQESSDDAWSLLVNGNIDVYMCPGDHLALSEPADAFVTGSILATALGVTYRQRFGLLKHVQRSYLEKKAVQKFVLGVEMFLHSKKGSKPPKLGKLYLEEGESRLVFKATNHVWSKGERNSQRSRDKVIDLTGLSNVLPGRHVAKTIKIIKPREVRGHQTGSFNQVVGIVMCNHRVYSLEVVSIRDLKALYQMMEAVLGVSMTHQQGTMA